MSFFFVSLFAVAIATVLQAPSDPVQYLIGNLQLIPPGMVFALQTSAVSVLKLLYVTPIDGSTVPWWCNSTGTTKVGSSAVQTWVLYTNSVQPCAFQALFQGSVFTWGLNMTIPAWQPSVRVNKR
jgi:hypothetical protein